MGSWGTTAMQDSLILSPNTQAVSATGGKMLKPYHTHYHISPCMNTIILGVHSDTCGPWEMIFSRACCNYDGPICTGMPSAEYSSRNYVTGCCTTSVSAPRVPCCW